MAKAYSELNLLLVTYHLKIKESILACICFMKLGKLASQDFNCNILTQKNTKENLGKLCNLKLHIFFNNAFNSDYITRWATKHKIPVFCQFLLDQPTLSKHQTVYHSTRLHPNLSNEWEDDQPAKLIAYSLLQQK